MLTVQNLTVSYGGNRPAVEDVSFEIKKPALIGILGPNGAGKSTLIKGILKLVSSKGTVLFNQQPFSKIQREIAYVEQKSAIDDTFPITVRECVSLGLYPKMSWFKKISKTQWEQVNAALEKVNMLSYKNNQIGELSGGQFQRVLIARTLVQQAKFIFLDEPFVGIDATSEQVIMSLLRELRDEGKMILIVHHDLSKVDDYFDEILMMDQHLIAKGPTKETFTKEQLAKTYGAALGLGVL